MVVVVCSDPAGGRDVVLDGIVMWGVTVVFRGEHHGCLVCLRVLMVQVDHALTAVRCRRHTVKGGGKTVMKGQGSNKNTAQILVGQERMKDKMEWKESGEGRRQ